MKYRITAFVVVLTLLLVLCCHSVYADPACWSIWLSAGHNYSGSVASVGTDPAASDDYNVSSSYVSPADVLILPGYKSYVATYYDGSGTGTGPSGFYCADRRSPISLIPGESKTWRLYLWAVPDNELTYLPLEWGLPNMPAFRYSLTLISKPAEVMDAPPVGNVWNLPNYSNSFIDLPIFRTDNGLEGYVFDLTATAVPEPASLALLGVGLAPLAMKLRRKRS
jgi:hypothetical protein